MYLGENCAQGHFCESFIHDFENVCAAELESFSFKDCTEEEEGVGTTPGLERSLNELHLVLLSLILASCDILLFYTSPSLLSPPPPVTPGDTTTTFCGTPEYLAPEVLKKQDYGRPVDWWCLGVVTYEMMYGLPPFYSRDVAEMYDNILHKPLRLRPHISPSARNLLEGLLKKDKTQRLGSEQGDYHIIMAHPFFRAINWDLLHKKKLQPPFNPNVRDDLDLRHFDPEFTREAVSDTPSPPKSSGRVLVSVTDDTFAGFSYVPPPVLDDF